MLLFLRYDLRLFYVAYIILTYTINLIYVHFIILSNIILWNYISRSVQNISRILYFFFQRIYIVPLKIIGLGYNTFMSTFSNPKKALQNQYLWTWLSFSSMGLFSFGNGKKWQGASLGKLAPLICCIWPHIREQAMICVQLQFLFFNKSGGFVLDYFAQVLLTKSSISY